MVREAGGKALLGTEASEVVELSEGLPVLMLQVAERLGSGRLTIKVSSRVQARAVGPLHSILHHHAMTVHPLGPSDLCNPGAAISVASVRLEGSPPPGHR